MHDDRTTDVRPDKTAAVTATPELDAPRPLPWRVPGPILGLIVLLALFALLLQRRGELTTFLSLRNLQGLMHECRIPAVVALGMLLIIITGGIDLSVGSVAALVTVVTMQVFRLLEERGYSPAVNSLAAVGA